MHLPAPTEADISRIVGLIVDAVQPLSVVLFGSAARGEQRDGSDLDFMVVVPEGVDRRETARSLYRVMYHHRIMVPTQFVVANPSGYEAHKNTIGMVYRDIQRDGREVYAA